MTDDLPQTVPFVPFPKIPRFSRDITITEKIDGTNGVIYIAPISAETYPATVCTTAPDGVEMAIKAGSRNRWLNPTGNKKDDNYGFGQWVIENADELVKLGTGHHYGEWWGQGIQHGYGLKEKRFSLFNTGRWHEKGQLCRYYPKANPTLPPNLTQEAPSCVRVVPILYEGPFDTDEINYSIKRLQAFGSFAVPGWTQPEGIVIYHTAGGHYYKKTLLNDASHKGTTVCATSVPTS